MIRNTLFTALLSLSVAGTAFAAGDVVLNDENTTKIRTMLTDQGYEVAKIKLEDGMYEAYARKDGKKYEVFMDGDFSIVKIEDDD